jgi:hypothetical protein
MELGIRSTIMLHGRNYYRGFGDGVMFSDRAHGRALISGRTNIQSVGFFSHHCNVTACFTFFLRQGRAEHLGWEEVQRFMHSGLQSRYSTVGGSAVACFFDT